MRWVGEEWVEWVLAGIICALLAVLALLSCTTTGVRRSVLSGTAVDNMFRLSCICGGVAWLRVETEPRLKVIATSENAPLGIYVPPSEDGTFRLKCCCGFTHWVAVMQIPELVVGLVHSEPPPPPPKRKQTPVFTT